MIQDLKKNEILKKMWMIDEKISKMEILTQEEIDFYNIHLKTIQEYYKENNLYWQNKVLI